MKIFNFLALALCILSFAACTEIFEKDIEDEKITIYTPSGKDSLSYTQTFWWNQIDFATSYQLQVVSPNFAAPEKMILDTIIKTNRFMHYLGPGEFEWKVRAMNGAYKSNFFGNTFKIVTTKLSSQVVQLALPENGAVNKEKSILFSWHKLLGATKYKIQIATDLTFSDKEEFSVDGGETNIYPYVFADYNTYYWRVMALNDSNQTTPWSTPFVITIDNKPSQVSLTAPSDGATDQPLNVSLKWVSLGTGYKYDVYTKVGSSGSFDVFKADLTTNTTTVTGTSGQTIYWKVIGKNKDGVEGVESETRSFKIK
jgi:hypothetical protein